MFSSKLYFPLATYFASFAAKIIKRWRPFVILVTGTAGKTTTMLLIEHIFDKRLVLTTHKANTATGLPLFLLGLRQRSFTAFEWLKLIILAPIKSMKTYKQRVLLYEADTDRTGEMEFITQLLKPDITCWVSAYAMHTQGFAGKTPKEVKQNMIQDFGFSLERNQKICLVNGDAKLITSQLKRTANPIGLVTHDKKPLSLIWVTDHHYSMNGSHFIFRIDTNLFNALYQTLHGQTPSVVLPNHQITVDLPLALVSPQNAYGLAMALIVGLLFSVPVEKIVSKLKTFRLPAGRMNLFAGKNQTLIIDSTYNASRIATEDALLVLKKLGGRDSLAVLGDMRELGVLAKAEHEKLMETVFRLNIPRLVLIGPQMIKFAVPLLTQQSYEIGKNLWVFEHARDAKQAILTEKILNSGDVVLFKGSQNTLFLESIVESLLTSKKDIRYLCRRGNLWDKKRKRIYG